MTTWDMFETRLEEDGTYTVINNITGEETPGIKPEDLNDFFERYIS